MELTDEHYALAKIAYDAYCKQTGGKSLATGDTLPAFDGLRQAIKDAWAASAIALANQEHSELWKIRTALLGALQPFASQQSSEPSFPIYVTHEQVAAARAAIALAERKTL